MILEKETSIYDYKAAQVATNYLYYDSTNGLVVSRDHAVSSETELDSLTDGNVRITGNGMDIYNGQKKIASYGESIMLGDKETDVFYSTITGGGFDINAKIEDTNTQIFHVGLAASSSGDYAYTQKEYTDLVDQYDMDVHTIWDYFAKETNLGSVQGVLSNGQTVEVSSDTSVLTHYTWTYKMRDGNNPNEYELVITYAQPTSGAYYVKFIANIASVDDNTIIGTYYTLGTRLDDSINGAYSITGGYNCEAEGQYSIAFGDRCHALSSHSFVAGEDCTASGNHAFLFGTGLSCLESGGQFIIGKYNYAPTHSVIWCPAFVIGNGTADGESVSQSDAFWVQASGNVGLKGSLTHCGSSPFALGNSVDTFYIYNDGNTTSNRQVLASSHNKNYFGNPDTETQLETSNGTFSLNNLIYPTGTFTSSNAEGFGYITSSGQQCTMHFFVDKTFLAHKTVTVTAAKNCALRSTDGKYISALNADLTNYIESSKVYTSGTGCCPIVKVTFKNSSGWGHTNNIPVCGDADLTFKVS